MPKSLQEYADWLDSRDLVWPRPPEIDPPKATPFLKPLPGIRAVTWDLYGTLLRISDGELLHLHPQRLRMQVALEKTVEEFKMWGSMYRTPEPPWEYMFRQYQKELERRKLAGTGRVGDVPEVNSAELWRKLLGQLEQKEYQYDASFYGDMDELAERVAYFFHASLQGVEAAPNALAALSAVAASGRMQTLLADAQPFTLVQMLRALRAQGTLPPAGDLLAVDCAALSFREGVRTPSRSLFKACLERLGRHGIEPGEVLHVGCRLRDDLAIARQLAMRTALYAGDSLSLRATREELKDRELRPDRLLTDLLQIRDVLNAG
jgi:FMN phosphatase YigB (HAD superfamily)